MKLGRQCNANVITKLGFEKEKERGGILCVAKRCRCQMQLNSRIPRARPQTKEKNGRIEESSEPRAKNAILRDAWISVWTLNFFYRRVDVIIVIAHKWRVRVTRTRKFVQQEETENNAKEIETEDAITEEVQKDVENVENTENIGLEKANINIPEYKKYRLKRGNKYAKYKKHKWKSGNKYINGKCMGAPARDFVCESGSARVKSRGEYLVVCLIRLTKWWTRSSQERITTITYYIVSVYTCTHVVAWNEFSEQSRQKIVNIRKFLGALAEIEIIQTRSLSIETMHVSRIWVA